MTTRITNNYGWERPDLIHKNSVMWNSRLSFILKELEFLNTLLNDNIYPITESQLAMRAEILKEKLLLLRSEVNSLLNEIKMHINGVKVLYLQIKPHEEDWTYKHEHRKIMIKMHEFDSKYQNLKKEIFKTVKEAIRHHKQKKITSS